MNSGRSRRAVAKAVRGRRRRTPWLEGLEDRTVLSPISATIAADGVLTLELRDGGSTSFTIEVVDGEYRFFDTRDWHLFRIDTDAAGLGPTISLQGVLSVRGITGIDVEAEANTTLRILSTDVPTTIHIGPGGGMILLGSLQDADGLAAISAPVDVRTTSDFFYINAYTKLWINDGRRSGDVDYTVTSHSLTSTGGFGGVTFAGLDRLEFDSYRDSTSELRQRFDVLSTPAGYTRLSGAGAWRAVFNVDATMGPDERPPMIQPEAATPRIEGFLQLEEGGEYNIKRTPSPMWINAGLGDINITDEGSTAGITDKVTIGPSPSSWSYPWGGPWQGHILIDASADADPQDALLQAGDRKTAVLTGAAGGAVVMNPEFYGAFEYRAPLAKANSLKVDLTGASPLPDGPGTFIYDGGSQVAGDGPGPKLTLLGEPILRDMNFYIAYTPLTQLPIVAYEAISPDSGGVRFGWSDDPRSTQSVIFRGLAGGSFVDLMSANTFSLWNRYSASLDLTVTAGAVEDGMQTLQFSSPGFVTTAVANKKLVNLFLDHSYTGGVKTIDYRSPDPVAGLEQLELTYDFNGGVVALPPGAATTVQPVPPPGYLQYAGLPAEIFWTWTDGFPKGVLVTGGAADNGGAGSGVSTAPHAPTPSLPDPPSTTTDPTVDAPVSTTTDPTVDAPVSTSTPPDYSPTAGPSEPSLPEMVGGIRPSLFGTAMRTTPTASAGSSRRAILRAERLARLAALRSARAERLWHAAAHLRRAWPAG